MPILVSALFYAYPMHRLAASSISVLRRPDDCFVPLPSSATSAGSHSSAESSDMSGESCGSSSDDEDHDNDDDSSNILDVSLRGRRDTPRMVEERWPVSFFYRPVGKSWLPYLRSLDVHALLKQRSDTNPSAFFRAFEMLKSIQTVTTKTAAGKEERVLMPHHVLISYLLTDPTRYRTHAINMARQLYLRPFELRVKVTAPQRELLRRTKKKSLKSSSSSSNRNGNGILSSVASSYYHLEEITNFPEEGLTLVEVSIPIPKRRVQFADILRRIALDLEADAVRATDTSCHARGRALINEAMRCTHERLLQLSALSNESETPRPLAVTAVSPSGLWSKLQALCADAKIDLAYLHERTEQRTEALAMLSEVRALLVNEVYPGQDHEAVATVHHNLGVLLNVHMSDFPAADRFLQIAIDMRRRLYSGDDDKGEGGGGTILLHENLADSVFARGACLERIGDKMRAVDQQLEAVNLYRQLLSIRLKISVARLAAEAREVGSSAVDGVDLKEQEDGVGWSDDDNDENEDESDYKQKSWRDPSLIVHSNIKMLQAMNSCANSLERLGDCVTSRKLKLEALRCAQRLFEQHEILATVMDSYASTLEISADGLDESFPLKLQALALRRRIFAPRIPVLAPTSSSPVPQLEAHNDAVQSLRSVADSLELLGKHSMALLLRKEAVDMLKQLQAASGAADRVRALLQSSSASPGLHVFSFFDEQLIGMMAQALLDAGSSFLRCGDVQAAEKAVCEAFDQLRVLHFRRPELLVAEKQHPDLAAAYLLRGRILLATVGEGAQRQKQIEAEGTHFVQAALQLRQHMYGLDYDQPLTVEAAACLCSCPLEAVADPELLMRTVNRYSLMLLRMDWTAPASSLENSCLVVAPVAGAARAAASSQPRLSRSAVAVCRGRAAQYYCHFAKCLERLLFWRAAKRPPRRALPLRAASPLPHEQALLKQESDDEERILARVVELYSHADRCQQSFARQRENLLRKYYDRNFAPHTIPTLQQQQRVLAALGELPDHLRLRVDDVVSSSSPSSSSHRKQQQEESSLHRPGQQEDASPTNNNPSQLMHKWWKHALECDPNADPRVALAPPPPLYSSFAMTARFNHCNPNSHFPPSRPAAAAAAAPNNYCQDNTNNDSASVPAEMMAVLEAARARLTSVFVRVDPSWLSAPLVDSDAGSKLYPVRNAVSFTARPRREQQQQLQQKQAVLEQQVNPGHDDSASEVSTQVAQRRVTAAAAATAAAATSTAAMAVGQQFDDDELNSVSNASNASQPNRDRVEVNMHLETMLRQRVFNTRRTAAGNDDENQEDDDDDDVETTYGDDRKTNASTCYGSDDPAQFLADGAHELEIDRDTEDAESGHGEDSRIVNHSRTGSLWTGPSGHKLEEDFSSALLHRM